MILIPAPPLTTADAARSGELIPKSAFPATRSVSTGVAVGPPLISVTEENPAAL